MKASRLRRLVAPPWLPRRSLAKRMGLSFLAAFATILFLAVVLTKPILLSGDEGLENGFSSDVAVYLAMPGLVRTGPGRIAFVPPRELVRLTAQAPQTWLVVEVERRRFTFGQAPDAALAALAALPAGTRSAELTISGLAPPLNEMSVSMHDTIVGRARIAAGSVDRDAVTWSLWLTYLLRSEVLWIVPLMGVLGILAVGVVVPFVLRPLRGLTEQAAELGPHDLARRLPEREVARELMPLVAALNAALDRLADAFQRQRAFIADVAHELRTPVTLLGLQVDALPPGAVRRELDRTVWRLGQLVGQMLDSQRLILGDERREWVELVTLAREVVADVAPLAMEQGYSIALASEHDRIEAPVDRQAIARALSNLVGNAIAHGGGRGLIEVRVTAAPAFEVADEGPGVPPDARERIFAPFRRERWDRDGCGLGLYLAREILRAHGGDAVLVASDAGATFRLDLSSASGVH